MNTKEAMEFDYINFLEAIKEFVTREFYNPPGKKDVNKRIDEVIDLLKRGEKFEQMWGEVELSLCRNFSYGSILKGLGLIMYKIEQKYFPKGN